MQEELFPRTREGGKKQQFAEEALFCFCVCYSDSSPFHLHHNQKQKKPPQLAYKDRSERRGLFDLCRCFLRSSGLPECSDKLTVASHQNSATSPILMEVSRVSHTSILNIFPTKISAGRPACRLSSTTVRSKLSSSVWKWKTSWKTESREVRREKKVIL